MNRRLQTRALRRIKFEKRPKQLTPAPATPAAVTTPAATPEPSVTPTEHAPIPARRRILPAFVFVIAHAGLLSGLKSASEDPQVSQSQ
jgi:hypothetical protein